MTLIPPRTPERTIMRVEYDDVPGDRPGNMRTVYYFVENLSDSQRINIQRQRFTFSKWVCVSEKTEIMPFDWLITLVEQDK
jgi:hypothetical protein